MANDPNTLGHNWYVTKALRRGPPCSATSNSASWRPDKVRRRRPVIRSRHIVCGGPNTPSMNTVALQIAVKFFPQFSSGLATGSELPGARPSQLLFGTAARLPDPRE